jgi:hypothetical protein
MKYIYNFFKITIFVVEKEIELLEERIADKDKMITILEQ